MSEKVAIGQAVQVFGRIVNIAENGDLMIEVPGLCARPFVTAIVVRPSRGVVQRRADTTESHGNAS